MDKMCNKGHFNMVFRDFLRSILYFARNRILRRKISEISNNLTCIESGNYKILLSDKITIYKDEAKEFAQQFEIIHFFKQLTSVKITIKNKSSDSMFCGQIAMLTANNEWKIFDIKNKQVLSVLNAASKEKYHKIYEVFQGKIPMTYLFDIREGIVEKLIQNIPRNTWGRHLIIKNYFQILSDQMCYLKQVPIAYNTTCLDLWNNIQKFQFDELNEIGGKLLQKIKGVYSIPCVFLHCDVHFGNTLFDGEKLYYIDFEHADKEIFFYDIFNCMFVEFILNHDPLLLSLYIKKDTDMFAYLHEIFHIMDMNFHEERYLDYLYIFLLARLRFTCIMLSKRVKYEKKRTLSAEIEHFSSFCNYLEEYDDRV